MTTFTAGQAKGKLQQLLASVAESHEPVQITGEAANGVLVSADDWRAIQETLYLLAVPGMRQSIRRGLKAPLAKCSEKTPW